MSRLTAKRRRALPRSAFAMPSIRKYPIDTRARARAALAYSAHKNTVGSYATVSKAVFRKYPSMKANSSRRKKGKGKRK